MSHSEFGSSSFIHDVNDKMPKTVKGKIYLKPVRDIFIFFLICNDG